MVIADTLALTLRKLGYEITFTALNYIKAIKMIDAEKPDLILLDINLGGPKDGIDVAKHVRSRYPIPIIFLTANSDALTVRRAKEVKPDAYMVKPFSKDGLFAAIEIAVDSHQQSVANEIESILVKDGYNYVKVFIKEIRFINSDQNYVVLNLNSNKRIMVRSTLTQIHDRLDPSQFIKINRGCIVNTLHVTKIDTENIFIDEHAFAVNKPQRDALVQRMDIGR